MWGSSAVGQAGVGSDGLSPQVEVFVDDVGRPEVAQKVQRRLPSTVIDRKVAKPVRAADRASERTRRLQAWHEGLPSGL